ncbi:MAG: hypothetical protein ACRDTF_16940, partial [Pseudonocardiaceae bacterium]
RASCPPPCPVGRYPVDACLVAASVVAAQAVGSLVVAAQAVSSARGARPVPRTQWGTRIHKDAVVA